MHELGILKEVIRQVEEVAKANGNPKVQTIVLQVGEVASVIPRFLEDCFPAARYKTSLEDTSLEIEVLPATGRCRECTNVFFLMEHQGVCPECQVKDFEMLSGREFIVKEIIVEDQYE